MKKWWAIASALLLVSSSALAQTSGPWGPAVSGGGGGIPQPVVNGECVIGSGGKAVWGSCSGSGSSVSSVTNSDGTLTISPTTGAVVGSLNLANANTWTGNQTYNANIILGTGILSSPAGGIQITGSSTGVSQLQSALSGSSNNTVIFPADSTATLVDTTGTQTLTNKTISGGTLSGTLGGTPTYSGVPIFSGLSSGTQVSCLGLDSGNHLVLNASACGSGGSTTVNLAPGLGNSQTSFNGTGTQQTVTNSSTLYPQLASVTKSANYTLNADCNASTPLCDTARLILADGSGSIQFTVPNPAGTLNSYQFGDQTGHGFTVVTVGGTATFFGCVSASPTSLTVPANFSLQLFDQGSSPNTYMCALQAQNQGTAAQQNAGTSGATLGLLNGNLTLSGTDNFTGTFEIGGDSLSLGGNTTLPAAPASTQCLHMSSAGAVTTTGSDCGSGGGSNSYCEAWITAASTIIANGTCGTVSSGTWTTPSWIDSSTSVSIELIGGGGGGAGTAGNAGGGGAAGGDCQESSKGLLSASTGYSFAIGALGTGGASGANNGVAGGNTTLTVGGTTYNANGGALGVASAGTALSLGGTASNCNVFNLTGGYGTANGSGPIFSQGASSRWGVGGFITANPSAGVAGTGYGAAGSGAISGGGSFAGGAGVAGVIHIILAGS